jgi:hypothetical protein
MGFALFLLAVLMLAVLPVWPHSRNWGYYPTGGASSIFFIVLLFMMLGVL